MLKLRVYVICGSRLTHQESGKFPGVRLLSLAIGAPAALNMTQQIKKFLQFYKFLRKVYNKV